MDRLETLYAVQDAAERTIAESGGTFERATLQAVEPATGYAVGGILPTITVAYPATRAAIADAILAMHRRMADRAPGAYIGTWCDDATQTVSIDAVVILPDRESAGILARTLRERAIYAFETGETIESARA